MIIDDPGRIEDIVKDLDKIVVYGDPLPIMGVGAEKLLMIFHFGNYREDMVFEEDTMLKISEDETVYGYPYNETDCLKELLHRLEQDN